MWKYNIKGNSLSPAPVKLLLASLESGCWGASLLSRGRNFVCFLEHPCTEQVLFSLHLHVLELWPCARHTLHVKYNHFSFIYFILSSGVICLTLLHPNRLCFCRQSRQFLCFTSLYMYMYSSCQAPPWLLGLLRESFFLFLLLSPRTLSLLETRHPKTRSLTSLCCLHVHVHALLNR